MAFEKPKFVKYWEGVFKVMEGYKEPDIENIRGYSLLHTILEYGMDTKQSHVIVMDDEWGNIYYIPANVIMKGEYGEKAHLNIRTLNKGRVKYTRMKAGTEEDLLCAFLPKKPKVPVDRLMAGEPFFTKKWNHKGNPMGVFTVIGKSDKIMRELDAGYKDYLKNAMLQLVETDSSFLMGS